MPGDDFAWRFMICRAVTGCRGGVLRPEEALEDG